MYTHTSLLRLTLSHLAIVALSVSVSVLIAVPAAIWVTRGAGREFLPLVRTWSVSDRPFRQWRCWRSRCR